jgi:HNH endonuclease
VIDTKCIPFEGKLNGYGYGNVIYDGKRMKASRVAWIEMYGPIPDGLVVDHMCHTEAVQQGKCKGGLTCPHRSCVNVNHLRLITQQENIMAGLHNIDNRSHCNQGHRFIKENIMVRKNGKRECAECNRVRARANYAKKKVGV